MDIRKLIDEAVFKFEYCYKPATILYLGEVEAHELRLAAKKISDEESYLENPNDTYSYDHLIVVLVKQHSHLAVSRLPEEN